LSALKTVLVFVVLSLGPLAVLTFSSITIADRAVHDQVVARLQTKSEMSGLLVEQEMQSVAEIVRSYATRVLLARSLGTGDLDTFDQDLADSQVGELLSGRPGIVAAFLTDTSCRLRSVRPDASQIVGQSFANEDWCKGVQASGVPYVSHAYRVATGGNQLVVAVAAPVLVREGDRKGEPIAYLVAAYGLDAIQSFATSLADAQGVDVAIADRNGTVLAGPSAETVLYSRRADPLLVEAFAGRSSVTEAVVDSERVLAAATPIEGLGWVVVAELPAREAFAAVSSLRSTVLRVSGLLALVLIAGAWFLFRALRLRQRAEAAVSAGEIRTRDILDAASDGFISLGDDGRVTGWNTAATELFGWSPQEAIGRCLSELVVPPDQRSAYAQGLQRFLRTGEGRFLGQRVEVETVDRAGRTLTVELAVKAVPVDQSWTLNAFVQDITDRKRDERELAEARDQALEASRLKSEFLANMSHEIRTPMNGVLGMTSLLLDTDLDPDQRDCAETVFRSGESLLAIINDILDFSKIEAGRLDLETIEFEIQHLIEDVTGPLSVTAVDKGIELVAHVHPDMPPYVRGDPGRVRQILANLLSNAIKFTESGEVILEVTVEARDPSQATDSPERTLRFDVTDTGIGIGIDQQTTIFQSFTQADSSTSRRYGGTGLGLTISKQLVTLMNGDIGVRSAVGTGSTFWFTLPVMIADHLGQRPRRNDLGGTRVLIVDDNATNRVMLGRTLESWGVDRQDVPDAASALRALRNAAESGRSFDAALVDFHMPGVDGITLAAQIMADPLIAPVALVLLTSSAQRGEASEAEAAGMAGYLSKPVHSGQLYACLATVLASDGVLPRASIVTRHRLAEAAIRGGTVLLAEDNPVNQRVASGMLQALGYVVEVVSDGREAVAAAASRRFDAILMDCQMPEMDGYEATRLIRAAEGTTRHTPIVAVSASAMRQDRERCLDAGMDDHLAKPLRRDQLAVLLEQFVHGSRPARDADDDPSVDSAQAPVGDLQTSIRSRLDELFEGLDGDIEADSAELLQSFLRRAADEIDQVTDALAVNDAQRVRQCAHSLKGMAANVGVTTVAMLAAEVEDAARDGHLHSVGPVGDDLRAALATAETTIHAMVPSLVARA